MNPFSPFWWRTERQHETQTRGWYFRILKITGLPCASPGHQKICQYVSNIYLIAMLSDEHALGAMLLEYFPGYGTLL